MRDRKSGRESWNPAAGEARRVGRLSPMSRWRARFRTSLVGPLALLALGVVVIGGLGGCRSATETAAADRAEIQAMLEEFLPVLGRAYAERDALAVTPWVAEKEIARIGKRIEELSDTGQVFVPTFRQLTIEDVNSWNSSNAFVTTVEVWDLRSEALGSGQVLTEVAGQVNRVKYQLKYDGGRWRILYRTITEQE